MDKQFIGLAKENKRKFLSGVVFFLKKTITYLFVLGFVTNVAVAKDPVSVGVVNVTFIMENAPQAEVASTKLKKKFLPQEKKLAEDLEEINELAAELRKVSASTELAGLKRQKERELRSRKRSRSRALQDFREELRFARDIALDEVQKEVFSAIDEVRKLENIDIILQDYVSAAQRVDITPLVLGYLQRKLNGNASVENNQLDKKSKPENKNDD